MSGVTLEDFSYDATGNRLSHARPGNSAAYGYPATSHRLSSVGAEARTYSAAGNTTAVGAQQVQYSGFNRYESLPNGLGDPLQSNGYNGRGEREWRRMDDESRFFGYDESGHLLFEGASDGGSLQVRQLIVWLDGQPMALRRRVCGRGAVHPRRPPGQPTRDHASGGEQRGSVALVAGRQRVWAAPGGRGPGCRWRGAGVQPAVPGAVLRRGERVALQLLQGLRADNRALHPE